MKAQDLKNSILQYAIQGKLVSQDENDEPAEVLYAKIQAEKQKLIKEGKIKKDKPLPPITEDEIPFPIPPTWKWVRLGEIGLSRIGLTYHPSDISPKGTIVLRSGNIQNNKLSFSDIVRVNIPIPENLLVRKGDIIICARNGSKTLVGKSALIGELDEAMSFGAFMAIFRCPISPYVKLYLDSPLFKKTLSAVNTVTINQITQQNLNQAILPLPPLEEQKRIVAKIEELEPLINQYDQAEQELSTLNDKFPDQLKKSILQYAIQGKLVAQDENDEPAEVLYAKIQAEKQQLIKEGKIKKDKPLPPITEDEIPFPIPPTWKWVRLGEIVKYIQRGKSPEYTDIKKVPVISQKCNQWNGLDMSSVKFITERSLYNYNHERYLLTNDLLLNSTGTGTVGRVGIYYANLNPYHIAVADSHVTVVRPLWGSSKYLYNFFASPYIQLNIENLCDGSTNQIELALQTVKKILIPLPPLAEQHRIVARVAILLEACDKLHF